ncbi:MAG: GreA/GreB family elongation factor [Marinobacter sp.]|uniref:GreA/GreB family elongation factor n=1 Tax=Marinobacter sp. TaxID=50741 RepID=UPI0032988119
MKVDVGFLASIDALKVLRKKYRRLIKAITLGDDQIAMIGSCVTIMDCADLQTHKFRLVESIESEGANPKDLPIDSSLGLALLASKPGDYLKLSLGGEEGGIVILSIT